MNFSIQAKQHYARATTLELPHGSLKTPIFMPVGTHATVKTLRPDNLVDLGAQIILGNTFHLMLQPGAHLIAEMGGLHEFMGWNKPILTDSGGFQVFSLKGLNKITEEGVLFSSPYSGEKVWLTPEVAMRVQRALNSDIAMIFDECTPYPATHDVAARSMELSLRWAERSYQAFQGSSNNLFAIVQGGMHIDLRLRSLEGLTKFNFQGFALGGLSVGEPKDMMREVIERVAHCLPEERPRYLMGVGKPRDLVHAILYGVDMFDCVLPSRNARNGYLYTWEGLIRLRNAQYKRDYTPLSASCSCYTCKNFTKAYLHHLDKSHEFLGLHLNSLHNLHFYLDLVTHCREKILEGTYDAFAHHFLNTYAD
jgi:queuine tRNA-ribosyltransferase